MPTHISAILMPLVFTVLLVQTAVAQGATAPSPVVPSGSSFICTEVLGLLSTGEWWDGGFYTALGDLKTSKGDSLTMATPTNMPSRTAMRGAESTSGA